jgi:copper homeostasis protein
MKKQLEIACFNMVSALVSQQAGADRVELCDGFNEGGTTPALETVQKAHEKITIDLYVMIRPRGGNFVYTEEEFSQMKTSIEALKPYCKGFVFGILNRNNTVNIKQNSTLVHFAHPLPCTFHRAFDEVDDYEQALEDVICCGFSTLLTSGTYTDVIKGKEVLKKLVVQAQNRITIMPGGGLRSLNIQALDNYVQATFYHSSALLDHSRIANTEEILKLKSQLHG